jgi:hypothetical protein
MERSAIRDRIPDCAALHPGYGSAKNRLASPPRLAKQRLPGVLAVAGTSVLAFRKPISLGDHSFHDVRMDCSKGEETCRFGGIRAGALGFAECPDPVQDCRRPRRDAILFNGLIAWPAQTGEDRILLFAALLRRAVDWVRTSTPRAQLGSGGQAFQYRPARRVQRPCVLRSGLGGTWVQPGGPA